MRSICKICKITDNIEEGIECHKCKYWYCFECISFENGEYYCDDCINDYINVYKNNCIKKKYKNKCTTD